MTDTRKERIKKILGNIPLTAEFFWLVNRRKNSNHGRYSLHRLQEHLPEMVEDTKAVIKKGTKKGKNVFVFASLHYWIEETMLTALGLTADGNSVSFGYYPYSDWFTDQTKFDLRHQDLYTQKILKPAEDLLHIVSFLNHNSLFSTLPVELQNAVKEVSMFDTQYTLQIEEFDLENPTYQFRFKRNMEAAHSVYLWMKTNKPDVVVVPNGTILEFGVVYRIAKYLKIPVCTYEFSDQKGVFWLGQNTEVMRQDTSLMWNAKEKTKLTSEQEKRIKEMFEARHKARTVGNFTRQWQSLPSQGALAAKETLKLDDRPIVLLATNVLGDSLTLGRQVFTKTMAEWVNRTILYFTARNDVQLIIRIHPGEILSREYSMIDVVKKTLPRLPDNIHVIHPEEKINTYDLVELTDVGLVYTTTVGLEMALKGIPVVVGGKTHYRNRGFTYDPDSWVDYFKTLGKILESPKDYRLDKAKIDLAWKYAYHFFFTYPLPFPWHFKMWPEYEENTIAKVFHNSNWKKYANTFKYLTGEPIDWNR